MKDCFFTLGGGQFWEDLFIYNDWRIQRNLTSKVHRLLDKHDIIREEGTFTACLQEWNNYKKALDLPKRNNHLIICLHSYGQTRKIFNNFITTLKNKNLSAESVNYPSMQRNITAQIKQIETLLKNSDDIEKVSFVTYGSGNILLEQLLLSKGEWKQSIKLGRIVEIAPWVGGNPLFTKLCNFKLADFILGPMAKDFNTKNLPKLHHKPDAEVGIIISKPSFFRKLLTKLNLVAPIADAQTALSFCGAKATTRLTPRNYSILKEKALPETALKFIQNGKFI